jgi:hypothetical protein
MLLLAAALALCGTRLAGDADLVADVEKRLLANESLIAADCPRSRHGWFAEDARLPWNSTAQDTGPPTSCAMARPPQR